MSLSSRRDFLKRAGLAAAALNWNGTLGGSSAELAASALPPDTKPLRYAVVGIGRLAEGEVLPAFRKTKLSRLTGLVSGHPDKAVRFARQYGVPEKNIYNYRNYDDMVSNPEIDAVYIALPNSLHAEYTMRAAKAGKDVLCEKPMANSVKDCEEMIAACRGAGRKLMIAYRLQYEPNNLEAVRLARSKEFGPLKIIDAQFGFAIGDPNQWRLKKDLAGGGSLMDIGIYCLQATRYLSGEEPTQVTAYSWSTDPVKYREVEENITFTLRFPSGLVASCYSSYGLTGVARYRAAGPEGWVEMDPAYLYRGLRLHVFKKEKWEDRTLPAVDQFATEIDQFSADVRAGRNPKASGEEGLRDIKIMTAIYAAARTGATVTIG